MIFPTLLVIPAFLLPFTTSSPDSRCTSIGGSCFDWRYHKCIAGYETGRCSGDNNRRCCKPCDNTCASDEASYDDRKCEDMGGVCMHNSNYCAGRYFSGHCGGPAARQCCTSGSEGSCNLIEYSSAHIHGHNGLEVRVHRDFVGAMYKLDTYAGACHVTVYVTNAFRKAGQNLDGTVVPPATTSNHLVGHAIDFNLNTPNGWCNSVCLAGQQNSAANCFIDKAMNSGLRWGGVWNTPDPVHIDDGLNVYKYDEWKTLYYELQNNCS